MMHPNSTIDYHLRELATAKDPSNPKRILPTLTEADQVILDVGCGIGQSFVALDCSHRTCIGVDVDEEAIAYGKAHFGDRVQYFVADATKLPVESSTVDLWMSRVAFPYTNLPRAIEEARRVLRDGGRIWLTLHSREMVFDWLRDTLRNRAPRAGLQRGYVLLNGYVFKHLGVVIPYLNGSYESWQDVRAVLRLAAKHGFTARQVPAGQHVLVTGELSK